MIKGVLLAGGTGTRLKPMTQYINKHLLNVGGRPMVEHPLNTLLHVVDKPENIAIIYNDDRVKYLGNVYTYIKQDKPDGIASATMLAKEFVGKDDFVVICGDNFFRYKLKLLSPTQVWASEIPNRGLTILGAYHFNSKIFDVKITPSARGEYEMIDVISKCSPINMTKIEPSDWVDMGTQEGISKVNSICVS